MVKWTATGAVIVVAATGTQRPEESVHVKSLTDLCGPRAECHGGGSYVKGQQRDIDVIEAGAQIQE
jgi:hypothetical protein